jgi:hypothetical protein
MKKFTFTFTEQELQDLAYVQFMHGTDLLDGMFNRGEIGLTYYNFRKAQWNKLHRKLQDRLTKEFRKSQGIK